MDKTNESLDAAAVPMPSFGNIQNALAKELDEPSEEESKFFFSMCVRYLKDTNDRQNDCNTSRIIKKLL